MKEHSYNVLTQRPANRKFSGECSTFYIGDNWNIQAPISHCRCLLDYWYESLGWGVGDAKCFNLPIFKVTTFVLLKCTFKYISQMQMEVKIMLKPLKLGKHCQ